MCKSYPKFFILFSVIFIIIVGCISYSNSLSGEFQFDDNDYIVKNFGIKNICDISAIWKSLVEPTRFIGLYSFALNYHFHKLDVTGYHIVNLIIHLCTSLLLFWFVLLLCKTEKLKKDVVLSSRGSLALIAALIFVSHPIQTQAVTYISQRFASLVAMFYLISLCCYLKARLSSDKRLVYFFVSVISAIIAMFTKENAFTLPFMILLVEFIFLRNQPRKSISISHKWIFLLAMLGFIVIIPASMRFNVWSKFKMVANSGSHDGDIVNWSRYLITQFRVIVKYLQLLIFPIGQNLDYDFPLSQNLFDIKALSGLLLLISLFVLGVKMLSRNVLIGFGIIWFFITLSIEASIVPIQHVIFEHRVYFPAAGFCIVVSVLLHEFLKERKILWVVSFILIALLSFLTFQRNKVWQTDLSLWSDCVEKSPKKSRPRISLAFAHSRRGEYALAMYQLNEALQINPGDYRAYNGRGVLYVREGLYNLAMADYSKALELNKNYEEVYYNLGNLYRSLGQYAEAMKNYNAAVDTNKDYFNVYINRGNLFLKKGYSVEAMNDYQRALLLNPDSEETLCSIGNIYGIEGKYDHAINYYNQALEINPDFAQGYFVRGNAYELSGRIALAFEDYNKVLKFNPRYMEAYYQIGKLFMQGEKYAEALSIYDKALIVEPRYIRAYLKKSDIYFTLKMYDAVISESNKVLKIDPRRALAYYNKAIAFEAKGEFDNALVNAEKAEKLGQDVSLEYLKKLRRLIKK